MRHAALLFVLVACTKAHGDFYRSPLPETEEYFPHLSVFSPRVLWKQMWTQVMDLEEWEDLDPLSPEDTNAIPEMRMCVFLKLFDQCLDDAALQDLVGIVASHKAWNLGARKFLHAMFLEAFGEVSNLSCVLSQ